MQRVQYSYPRNIRYHRTKCGRPGVLAPGIGHPWLKPLSSGNDCTADASCENVERGDHDKPSLFRHFKAERDISQTIRSSWNSRSRYPLTIPSIFSSILSFPLRLGLLDVLNMRFFYLDTQRNFGLLRSPPKPGQLHVKKINVWGQINQIRACTKQ